jgi:ATP-binding cassette subfamily C protein LapB
MASGSEARRQRKWLREVLRPLRGAFRELMTATLFINLLALAVPVFVLQVYDRVVFFAGLSTLRGLVIGVGVALLFDFLLRQARSRMLQRAALHIDVELGRRLFDKIMSMPLRVLEGKPASHWQSLYRDIETVRNAFSGASAVLLADLPFAILFVGFITVIATPIAWLFLIIVPIFFLLAWGSGRTLSAANARERNAGLSRVQLVGEITAGRATIKALALDRTLRPVW